MIEIVSKSIPHSIDGLSHNRYPEICPETI
jgi:hypothetical protein